MSELTVFILVFGVVVALVVFAFALVLMRIDKQVEEASEPEVLGEPVNPGLVQPPTVASTIEAASAIEVASTTEAAPTPEAASAEFPTPPSAPIATPPSTTLRNANGPSAVSEKAHRSEASEMAHQAGVSEIARIVRTPDGMLILEAKGNWYLNRSDITDAQLLVMLDEFNRFLQPAELPPLASFAPPTPSPEPPPPPKLTQMVDGKPTLVLTTEEAAKLPLTQPSLSIFRQYRTLREREKQPQIKLKSVLEEIDEILQAKLAGTPLAERGLKVSADGEGVAVFSVDGQLFTGIDEVPDAEVRAMIQSAIREWEGKR